MLAIQEVISCDQAKLMLMMFPYFRRYYSLDKTGIGVTLPKQDQTKIREL